MKKIRLVLMIVLVMALNIPVYAEVVNEDGGGSSSEIVDVQLTGDDANFNKLYVTKIVFNKITGNLSMTIKDRKEMMLADKTDYLSNVNYPKIEVSTEYLYNVEKSVQKDCIVIEGKVSSKIPIINVYIKNDYDYSLSQSITPKSIIFTRKMIELASGIDEFNTDLGYPKYSLFDWKKLTSEGTWKHFKVKEFIFVDSKSSYDNVVYGIPESFNPSTGVSVPSSASGSIQFDFEGSAPWFSWNTTSKTFNWKNTWEDYEKIPLDSIKYSSFDIYVDGEIVFNKNIPDLTDTSDLDIPSISIHSLDAVDNFVMGTMTIDSRWLNNDPGIILKGENCTLEYRNYYTQVVDDHYLYYYEWYAHLLDTGSQTIKIKLNKFGNELINQSWTINNPEKQLYDMTEDEFIMSTWGKYFYLRLYSNDADMASKISKFALVNLEDDTVIEYPQYYKRYIEELDGYSQDRYLYIYQFPKKR